MIREKVAMIDGFRLGALVGLLLCLAGCATDYTHLRWFPVHKLSSDSPEVRERASGERVATISEKGFRIVVVPQFFRLLSVDGQAVQSSAGSDLEVSITIATRRDDLLYVPDPLRLKLLASGRALTANEIGVVTGAKCLGAVAEVRPLTGGPIKIVPNVGSDPRPYTCIRVIFAGSLHQAEVLELAAGRIERSDGEPLFVQLFLEPGITRSRSSH